MLKNHFWKIVILVAVILVAASVYYSSQIAKKANEGVVVDTHIKGNPDAAVTLVEYSDFECPACAQFYPYIKDIVEEHGEELRFEYRHFPLINMHPKAVPAARAAEAAGQQGKFFEMHDKLFEDQAAWTKSSNASAFFNQYAEDLGLDVDKFKLHMNSSIINDAIDDSFNDARERGYTGTPTILLNDKVMNITTFEAFEAEILAAIEVARTSNTSGE